MFLREDFMRVESISPMSYKAHIPTRLNERLFMEAHGKSRTASQAFLDQAGKFKNWGHDTSSLTLIEETGKNGINRALGLVNSYFAPFQKVIFPQKKSLLDTFMGLTERDVIEAEYLMNV